MGRRIRVAHCIETMHLGGVEQTRLTLARRLDPARFEQLVICTEARGDLPRLFAEAEVTVEAVGAFRRAIDWTRIRAARKLLAGFRPDIVHGGVFEGVVMATLAGRLSRVPVVIGEETADPQGRRWTGHLFLKGLSALADRMVAVSPFVYNYLVDDLGLAPAKVRLINNGIPDEPSLGPEDIGDLRESLGIAPDSFVIGTVGRLFDQQKRVSDVIRSMPTILAAQPKTQLLIVGDGVDRAMLEALAIELNLRDRVIFTGYQLRTRPFFQLMDLFVHAAASEAFGLVLAEAMLASKAVVATRVGGIPQVVEEKATALLVPPQDPQALAEAIVQLGGDPASRERMGAAGRRRAIRCFGEDRYIREVEALYLECFPHMAASFG